MSTPQKKFTGYDGYITVAERIEAFYSNHPEGRINTFIIEHDVERGFILMRAEVYRKSDDAQPSSTGHAYEIRNEGHVNKTSYIENCETGAVGRAIALLGFEVKRGIASKEEMQKQDRMPANVKQMPYSNTAKPAEVRAISAQEAGKRLVDINAVTKTKEGYVIVAGTGSHLVQKIEGKVGCNCEAFVDSIDPDYQCEHIFAAFEYATRQKELDQKAAAESVR
jgi:hypothetical protein